MLLKVKTNGHILQSTLHTATTNNVNSATAPFLTTQINTGLYFYKPHWWEGSAISRVHPLLVYTVWVMAVVHQGLKVRIMVRVSKV